MAAVQSHTIFVSGATGCQGGAVARQALSLGWTVHAYTRDTSSAAAQTLATAGAKLFRGSWDEEPALVAALDGCTAVFLNLYPVFADPDVERRQGEAILALAARAGVRHVVYSGGLGSEDPTRLRHYRPDGPSRRLLSSKWQVESTLLSDAYKDVLQSRTILLPGGFMANFLLPKVRMYGDFVATGVWTSAMQPDTRLALIDPEDIAAFAIAAIREPDRFNNARIYLSGDNLTVVEAVSAVSEAAGRQLTARFYTDKEIAEKIETDRLVMGQLLIRDMGQYFDLKETEKWGLPLTRFRDYLKREHKAVEETWGAKA